MRQQRTKVKTKRELSEQEFYKLWHKAHGVYCVEEFEGESSTALCHLIQPHLQREFPREAVEELEIEVEIYGWENNIEKSVSRHKGRLTEKSAAALERLWKSGEERDGHICADGKFRKWPGLACSNWSKTGVCPTCEGSGEACSLQPGCCLYSEKRCVDCLEYKSCPDCQPCKTCGGSGEIRDPKHKDLGVPCECEQVPCPDCQQFTFLRRDRLKYPDQRKRERRDRVRRGDAITYGRLEAIEAPSTRGRRKGDRREHP